MDIDFNDKKNGNRLAVIGAAGWFGREALNLGIDEGMEVLALGSSSGKLDISKESVIVHKHDINLIESFCPTIVVDAAFITRERIANLGIRKYIELNRELIANSLQILELKSVDTYIGFSSGATKHLAGQQDFSLEQNPYAFLKREYEDQIKLTAERVDSKIGIARVWSVSGEFCTKPNSFAFSSFINQAKLGKIFISSGHQVFRRYAPVKQVLQVARLFASASAPRIFDTGGPLVEIGELAKEVVEIVNPEATIERSINESGVRDDYFADGTEWREMLAQLSIEETTIKAQVQNALFGAS